MHRIESFVQGEWRKGDGAVRALRDATTGDVVAELAAPRIDGRAALDYARSVGSLGLSKLTFHERAGVLKALAKYLSERKQELYALSTATGATRTDSALDIEGGLGVLFSYASRALRELPNDRIYMEGASEALSKAGEFVGQHLCVSRPGACVQINAFNFPVWGMLEKFAPAFLAGSAVIVKPATATAFVAELAVKKMIESSQLPEGTLQLICGGIGDLFDHLSCQDSVAFTGSAATAQMLRCDVGLIANSTRFTAETDSLNACVLGPDAGPGTPEFDLFIKEIVREMMFKAGQRCTAIRRAIVPKRYLDAASDALRAAFADIVIGDPRREEVKMGPLVGVEQRDDVLAKIAHLRTEAELLTGDPMSLEPVGADASKGAFVPATLLYCRNPRELDAVHSVEAFGPVCTLMPYDDIQDAVTIANLGNGSLACSVFTADMAHARTLITNLAPYHGRVLVVNDSVAKHSTGHGSPLPGLIHGGPGRAGGGEELGGLRAVLHYMQRTAVQSSPQTIGALVNA